MGGRRGSHRGEYQPYDRCEEATFANTVTHEWDHGLGEIVTALLTHGFEITGLLEHRDFAKGGEVLYR